MTKSYKNKEIKRGYRENDILGGFDPYSASKASAELIIDSYFESFFKHKKKLKNRCSSSWKCHRRWRLV